MSLNDINPKDYNQYTFGMCIRKCREECGFSLRELAKMMGISPAYLSDIEKGNRRAPIKKHNGKDYMKDFIKYLQINEDEIISFYDMAAATRGDFSDIREYLASNRYARVALQLASKNNISDEEWKKFISDIELN